MYLYSICDQPVLSDAKTLSEQQREEIGVADESLLSCLRCYKCLRYPSQIANAITTVSCPVNGWKPFLSDVTLCVALSLEQHTRSSNRRRRNISINAVVLVIVAIILGLVIASLTKGWYLPGG